MTGSTGAVRGIDGRAVLDAAPPLALAILVGLIGGVAPVLALGVPIVAAVASLVLRGRSHPWAQEYGLAPFLIAVGVVALLAQPSLLTGALAGFAGVAILLWNARLPGETGRATSVEGVVYPAAGLGIALLASIALPAANAAVGLAALAIVGAIALVLWALGSAMRDGEVGSEAI